MRYFDTSFLVPLFLPEATSDRIATFFGGIDPEECAVSHWTRVEFASVMAREVRMMALDAERATRADASFQAMVERSFAIWLPDAEDYSLARLYLRRFESGLRAGDALHLAVAAGHGAQTIYTLDKTMLKAGSDLGLPVSTGIQLP